MKRKLWAAAVAGLVACGAVVSQDGRLAPTAPIVPAPVMSSGGVRAPAAGNWGNGEKRLFASNNWSPLRSPVAPAAAEVPPPPAHGGFAPPPPAAHGGSCAPAGCGPTGCGRDRSCWDKFKAWLGYAPSKTELRKLQPAPYVTPLQGMFYCSTPAGCAPCGTGHATPVYGAPAVPPPAPGPVMPTPMPPKVAGPVTVAPAAPRVQPTRSLPGTVVPAGFKQPK
jgi:hypothetical protein